MLAKYLTEYKETTMRFLRGSLMVSKLRVSFASAQLWCFLWYAFDQTTEQTIETPLIMTSLSYDNHTMMQWVRRSPVVIKIVFTVRWFISTFFRIMELEVVYLKTLSYLTGVATAWLRRNFPNMNVIQRIQVINRGYPAKRALSAMRKHGW